MSAPVTIDDLVGIHMTAEAGAPAEVLVYEGQTWGVPRTALEASGSGPDNPGTLLGIFGYLRPYTGAPSTGPLTIAAEFVMAARVPAPITAAFLTIPGPEKWIRVASRNTYSTIGRDLILNEELPAAQVVTMLTDLYNAAVAEAIARRAQGYPVAGT